MAEVSPRRVVESLQKVINARKPSALIEQFINWTLTNYVNVENLNYAIQNNADILLLAFNHAHLGHPLVAPAFRLVLQMYFTEFVEYYIGDATRIYEILSRKKEVKEILDTPQGIDYLNRCCKFSYEALYNFCWADYTSQGVS